MITVRARKLYFWFVQKLLENKAVSGKFIVICITSCFADKRIREKRRRKVLFQWLLMMLREKIVSPKWGNLLWISRHQPSVYINLGHIQHKWAFCRFFMPYLDNICWKWKYQETNESYRTILSCARPPQQVDFSHSSCFCFPSLKWLRAPFVHPAIQIFSKIDQAANGRADFTHFRVA